MDHLVTRLNGTVLKAFIFFLSPMSHHIVGWHHSVTASSSPACITFNTTTTMTTMTTATTVDVTNVLADGGSRRWWAAMVSGAWKTQSPYRWVNSLKYRWRVDIVDDTDRRRTPTNVTCAPYQRRIIDKRGEASCGDLLSYQLHTLSISDRRASGQDNDDSTGLSNVEKRAMGIARSYVTRRSSVRWWAVACASVWVFSFFFSFIVLLGSQHRFFCAFLFDKTSSTAYISCTE